MLSYAENFFSFHIKIFLAVHQPEGYLCPSSQQIVFFLYAAQLGLKDESDDVLSQKIEIQPWSFFHISCSFFSPVFTNCSLRKYICSSSACGCFSIWVAFHVLHPSSSQSPWECLCPMRTAHSEKIIQTSGLWWGLPPTWPTGWSQEIESGRSTSLKRPLWKS